MVKEELQRCFRASIRLFPATSELQKSKILVILSKIYLVSDMVIGRNMFKKIRITVTTALFAFSFSIYNVAFTKEC